MWNKNWREQLWSDLDQPWDLIVIGGGITGAGVLREASRAGLKTLLVEAHDFASGTSSRSSKMVHGGLRYLRNAQVKLTVASVHERERLLREGRGLIEPLNFLIAGYLGDRPPAWVFGMGLMVYDVLGRKWAHHHYDAPPLRELCPLITERDLLGGYQFYDAQTDDARLVLRVIGEAVRDGGAALNYARVEGLLRNRAGQVRGVQLRDQVSGAMKEALAAVVINATGAWSDQLRAHLDKRPCLRPLRGSHLVIPWHKLPLTQAVNFLHPIDQRPVFAFPWEGITLVGTTDVDHGAAVQTDPQLTEQEFDYLMMGALYAFRPAELHLRDVQATFSGIRPVVDTGQRDPSKESRESVLWDEHGLLTIAGGKLTTFRLMAIEALRAVRRRLPHQPRFSTKQRMLDPIDTTLIAELDPGAALRLFGRYGVDTPHLLQAAQRDELQPIGDTAAVWAELRWAARAEGIVHLDDLLLRRVRLGLLLPQGGMAHMDRIRSIAQPELGWSDERWAQEVSAYTSLWNRCYSSAASLQGVSRLARRRFAGTA
jgi:glycerol-3-phosphate dehydrogenase